MAYTTINKSTDYFNTKLYTGNGSAGNAQTGVGFQPDFTWIKARAGTQGTQSHILSDAVRGAGKFLYSDSNDAESTDTNRLTSFNADGFTVGSNNSTNASSTTYASWNWKANGAGSSNTDGSVSSTVSVDTTAGFSIVTWTSTGSAHTVGHGLGSTPAMIIMKGRHETNSWMVYHHKNTSAPETDYLELNSSNATADWTTWNDTAPTNSVFSLGTWSGNDAGGTMVAYCFAEKTGYSKFGSYVGNGSADNAFIYTGFKPKFFITKRSSDTGNWVLWDSARTTSNPMEYFSYPNDSGAEGSGSYYLDFVSNGIKIRDGNSKWGASGSTYIYMAFGQSLVGSNNVPCTAR